MTLLFLTRDAHPFLDQAENQLRSRPRLQVDVRLVVTETNPRGVRMSQHGPNLGEFFQTKAFAVSTFDETEKFRASPSWYNQLQSVPQHRQTEANSGVGLRLYSQRFPRP